jgi:ATP-dependent exoDNAse (exonuclease V) beta subunit
MSDFSENSLQGAMESTINRYGSLLDESALESIRRRVLHVIKNEEFKKLTDAEIYKEQPISYEGEIRYLDLLVKHKECWVVIDYKSSKEYSDKHIKQLQFYKKALEGITNERVEAYLYYLLDEGVEIKELS